MQKGLVSIITPCYNTANYISRLLDSILSQTYPKMEMIVIDDGSTDKSAEIVKGYIPQFEKRGLYLTCIQQENSGQSVAIQKGLQLIHGEFLVWPDSDDYYASPNAIEKMVKALQTASSDFAMVRVQEQIIADNTAGGILSIQGLNRCYEEPRSLFDDCLYAKSGYYFCPGGYMVRMSALIKTTKLNIYTAKDAGQNWQLMLPILYRYRCLTIPEILYTVVNRVTSHSRGQFAGYEKTIHKFQAYEETIQNTLDRMQMEAEIKNKHKRNIHIKYLHQNLLIDYQYKKWDIFYQRYEQVKSLCPKANLWNNILYLTAKTNLATNTFCNKVVRNLYNRLNHDCYSK